YVALAVDRDQDHAIARPQLVLALVDLLPAGRCLGRNGTLTHWMILVTLAGRWGRQPASDLFWPALTILGTVLPAGPMQHARRGPPTWRHRQGRWAAKPRRLRAARVHGSALRGVHK